MAYQRRSLLDDVVMRDDKKDDQVGFISKRCYQEKGRDLCLYSSTEFPRKTSTGHVKGSGKGRGKGRGRGRARGRGGKRPSAHSLSDDEDTQYDHITKKFYTNMYMLSKWSKFVRSLYKNDTLSKFANKMDDGTCTYIMGIPASSKAIEHVLVSVNLEDDEIVNPTQGSVDWVAWENVIDAMDIANFLQIDDILNRCSKVITKTLSADLGTQSRDQYGYGDHFYQSYSGYSSSSSSSSKSSSTWYMRIRAAKWEDKNTARNGARYLLALVSYLQNRTFDWSNQAFPNMKFIERFFIAFLSIKSKYISIKQKREMFNKYVKPGDHAYDLFYRLAFQTFGGPDV